MSLRGFHILFIVISVLLFAGTALWALVLTSEESLSVTLIGIGSVVCAIALAVYGVFFLRKARKLIL